MQWERMEGGNLKRELWDVIINEGGSLEVGI